MGCELITGKAAEQVADRLLADAKKFYPEAWRPAMSMSEVWVLNANLCHVYGLDPDSAVRKLIFAKLCAQYGYALDDMEKTHITCWVSTSLQCWSGSSRTRSR